MAGVLQKKLKRTKRIITTLWLAQVIIEERVDATTTPQ